MFDAEVLRLFEWLKHFEAGVPLLDGGGQRYACGLMETRVRYSWFKASTAGLPSLCLSELDLAQPQRGFEFLAQVARHFAGVSHDLQAQVLYVEQPKGAVLCNWLADNGFSLCAAPGEERQSWYLRWPRAPERRHWSVDVAGSAMPSVRDVLMGQHHRSRRASPAGTTR
ncbi:hypothetical protein [Variovorax sp. OV329]|uniref:hypothetical protein n=1 Tax=Variovorax sp. OV329 TaxID=1882825 RepID=UPI0008E55ADC|nr:hypothetical protein [Variovorax sp. OV329]SFN27145.1 hypothetical protein SAMN05444747_1209 [Variovorax sp. OV329]